MNRVLLVVDMQNDFITGVLGTPEARAIVPTVKKLLKTDFFSGRVFTVDTHYYDYLTTQEGKMLPIPHCMYRSEGWGLQKNWLNGRKYRHLALLSRKERSPANIWEIILTRFYEQMKFIYAVSVQIYAL